MAGINQVFSLADDVARYVKACGKKSILQTKPINSCQLKDLHFTPKKIGDEIQLSINSQAYRDFITNWEDVLQRIKSKGKSVHLKDFTIKDEIYATFTTEEKVMAAYITEEFSDATNRYLRLGCEHEWYSWWADKGLDCISIPKYKEALKYAMDTLESKPGLTYRWQPAGSFAKDFNVYKIRGEAPKGFGISTKKGPLFRSESNFFTDIPKDSPEYMSIKRSKLQRCKDTAKSGDIIEDPTFVSTGQNIRGLEEFRRRLFYDHGYTHPELICIKGKNGKTIPSKLAGFRSYEKEVLYKADTRYRFIEEKDILSPSEIEGFEEMIKSTADSSIGFKPFKMIVLEEV